MPHGKTDKIPRQVGGRPASTTDPSTWTDYPVAQAIADKAGWGVGLVLQESYRIVFIDLDNAFLPDGSFHPKALAIVERFYGTARITKSQSGSGIHLLAFHRLTDPESFVWEEDGFRLEVYFTRRYMAIPRKQVALAGCEELHDATAALTELIEEFGQGRQGPGKRRTSLAAPEPEGFDWGARRRMAEELLGEVHWSETEAWRGYCRCPGVQTHTNPNGYRDCEVLVNGTATVRCLHLSCAAEVAAANKTLRTRIDAAEIDDLTAKLAASARPLLAALKLPELHGETGQGSPSAPVWARLTEAIVSGAEAAKLPYTPRTPLVGDWLYGDDWGFVYGARNSGKTMVGLELSARVVGAKRALGWWESRGKRSVLYVDAEMPWPLMLERMKRFDLEGERRFRLLHHERVWTECGMVLNLRDPGCREAIAGIMIEGDHDLLVLDNLSTLHPAPDENKTEQWAEMNAWLMHLRRLRKCVVILHHAGKSGSMRGASAMSDNAGFSIRVTSTLRDDERGLGARFAVAFDKDRGGRLGDFSPTEWWVPADLTEPVNIRSAGGEFAMLRLIVEDGVTRNGELAAALGVQPYVVTRYANKLAKAGLLQKRGSQHVPFAATEAGIELVGGKALKLRSVPVQNG